MFIAVRSVLFWKDHSLTLYLVVNVYFSYKVNYTVIALTKASAIAAIVDS